MPSLDDVARDKLNALETAHLRRVLAETAREDGIWVTRGGKRLLSFSCNDYLNLTHHPKVKAAAIAALEKHGAGAGASRLVTGNHPLYAELEARLANLKGTQAACVFGSGYLANAGIIPVIVGEGDLLLVDELSHSCLWAGRAAFARERADVPSQRSGSRQRAFERASREPPAHALIVTDSVFSMDGDRAPLAELAALVRRHDAWLMSDDAHGLGVVAHEEKSPVDLQMGTLSKALGSYGGYLCASAPVIDLVKTRARTLIYSTGLPPASVGGRHRRARCHRRRSGLRRASAGEGAGFYPRTQPAAGAKPHRADRSGRCAGCAGRAAGIGARRFPRHRDPPAQPCSPRGCASLSPPVIPDAEIARLARAVREKVLA